MVSLRRVNSEELITLPTFADEMIVLAREFSMDYMRCHLSEGVEAKPLTLTRETWEAHFLRYIGRKISM